MKRKVYALVFLMALAVQTVAKPIYSNKKHIKRLDYARAIVEPKIGPVIIDYGSVEVYKTKKEFQYTGILYYKEDGVCMQGRFLFIIGKSNVVFETHIFEQLLSDCSLSKHIEPKRNKMKEIFLGTAGGILVAGGIIWLLSTINIIVD